VGQLLTITYTWFRRCAIALVGGTVVMIGIVMIVTPGPAFVVIPAGLAILGLEFACARRWLHQLRTHGSDMFGKARSRTQFWFRCSSDRAARESSKRASRVHSATTSMEPAVVRKCATSAKASTKTGDYRVR
jgi:hypothetical protein